MLFIVFVALAVLSLAGYILGRYLIWPPYWQSGYTEGVPALTEEFPDDPNWGDREGEHTIIFIHLMERGVISGIDAPLGSLFVSVSSPTLREGELYETDRVFAVVPPAGEGYRLRRYFERGDLERPFRIRVLSIGDDGKARIEIDGPQTELRYPNRLEIDRMDWIIR